VCLLVQNGLRTLLGGGALGGGGAPTGLIAPGATHPRYATGLTSGHRAVFHTTVSIFELYTNKTDIIISKF
jgi:hypothetical protein